MPSAIVRRGDYKGESALYIRIPNHRGEIIFIKSFRTKRAIYWRKERTCEDSGDLTLKIELPSHIITLEYDREEPIASYEEK